VVNGQDAYLGDLLKRFSVEAPNFQIYVYEIDACTHGGLPQSRPRVYVVGVRRSALAASPHAMPDRIPALETELLEVDPRLKEFLDFRLENSPPEAVKQCMNHAQYVQRWEASHEGVGGQHVLCCDVNRCPAAPFGGASRCDGKSLTITPGNRALWMVSRGYARNIDRRLNLREHARLQGLFIETLCGMKPSAMRVAIGAATPPSCLGRVLAHLVRVVLRLPIPANRVRWPLPQPPQPAQPLAESEETESGDPAPPARRASILELLQAQKRPRIV
jgi:site-specific DNA-cytosine methylase